MQVPLSTKISLEAAQALEEFRTKTGKPVSQIVDEALKDYFIKNGGEKNVE